MKKSERYNNATRDAFVAVESEVELDRSGKSVPLDAREWEGIRIYKSNPERWTVQIRGYETLTNGKKGKAFGWGATHLSVERLRELRDACEAALADAALLAFE